MAEALRLFILAGEPSGDRIGADLVRKLRARTQVTLTGVGGPALSGEGLASIFPMDDLAVMGLTDVLARLPLLLWRARQTARAIIKSKPDIVVLIDAQVFSASVARLVRRAGCAAPMLLYVAPSVWAWKPERARSLVPLFEEILAVLPFEPKVMRTLGGPPTSYVGHPALTATEARSAIPARGALLLMPGSRAGELRRHLPIMARVAADFATHPRIAELVLPTPQIHAAALKESVARWAVPVRIISDEAEKRAAFANAIAAVAVTGTVTLELALSGVPMVTTYVGEKAQERAWRKYKARFASLPNIVLDRELVPEILDIVPHPDRVIAALRELLDAPARGAAQLEGFRRLRALFEIGAPEAPLEDAADRVLALSR